MSGVSGDIKPVIDRIIKYWSKFLEEDAPFDNGDGFTMVFMGLVNNLNVKQQMVDKRIRDDFERELSVDAFRQYKRYKTIWYSVDYGPDNELRDIITKSISNIETLNKEDQGLDTGPLKRLLNNGGLPCKTNTSIKTIDGKIVAVVSEGYGKSNHYITEDGTVGKEV